MTMFHRIARLGLRLFAMTAAVAAISFAASVRADTIPQATSDAQQSSVATNLGLYGGNLWDIAVDGNYVYATANGSPNGFFRSADGGATWSSLGAGFDYGAGEAVEVDPTTGDVYVAMEEGLLKSTDHGATLTKLSTSSGFPMAFSHGILLVNPSDKTVASSSDGGATFTSSAIDGTGQLYSLDASPTAGTFYATLYDSTTDASQLWKTTDSGATWTQMTVASDIPKFLHANVNPNNANEIALTNSEGAGVWRSLDGGSTWTKLAYSAEFVTWNASNRMYLGQQFSDDDGTTWTNMDVSDVVRGPGKTIVINASDPNILYGDSMGGIAKSTDGGLTWHNINAGITGVTVNAISQTTDKSVVWVASSQGLAKTTNFTSASPTWQFPVLPSAEGRSDSSGIGDTVWVKPDNANIILAGSVGSFMFRSTDGGSTWTLATLPDSINTSKFQSSTGSNFLAPYMIANDPTDPSVVYAAMASHEMSGSRIGAVIKSTDSGATWTDLAMTNDAPARSLAVANDGTLYVGTGIQNSTYKGIYKYLGGSWTLLTGIPTGLDIFSIVIDPENQSTVYVAASIQYNRSSGGFYKSTDAGATWAQITSGLMGYGGFQSVTVQRSTTPNTLYLAGSDYNGHGVLLKSSDAGTTWGLLYQGLKSETFNTVRFDGLTAGNKRGIFAMKSKAKFVTSFSIKKVKKNVPVTFTTTVRDKATKKLLANKTVALYRLDGKKWTLRKVGTTNKKGVVSFILKPAKTTQFRITWTPGRGDKEEYATSTSNVVKVTIK